jgi:hypothetical protein
MFCNSSLEKGLLHLRGDESVIQVLFIKATEDEFCRPAISTCAQKVTATLPEENKIMRDVWVEAVAQLIVGFTLN